MDTMARYGTFSYRRLQSPKGAADKSTGTGKEDKNIKGECSKRWFVISKLIIGILLSFGICFFGI